MNPFSELLVVELANVLAGPRVGQMMAELGARVIKVEPPGGDVTRTWMVSGEHPDQAGVTAYFAAVNQGKESVCLNLKTPEGKAILRKLLLHADVVITSYKPGDAEALGVDYPTLQILNNRLIYVAITGYGSGTDRAGYDAVIQAESGFMHMNGAADGPPTKLPVALMDVLASHQAREGLLAALWKRERYWKGSYVEVSLIDSALAGLVNQATNWLVAHHDPERIGSDHPNIVPYGTVLYDCHQQPLVLAIGTDKQFAALCAVLKQPQLVDDERFATNASRVTHREELMPILQAAIGDMGRAALLHELQQRHVPAGAIHTVREALQAFPDMLTGSTKTGLASIAWSPRNDIASPPTCGAHTLQVLQQLGYSHEEAEVLRQQSVINVAARQ